jgi:hypothetical protein
MKAIVVEFTPVWSGWAPAEKMAVGRPDGTSRLKIDSDRPKTDLPQFSYGGETPPFWTWFIENPRRLSP